MSSNDSTTMAEQDRKRDVCLDHSEPLRGYCDTCCKVICRDCTMSIKHNNHSFSLISECYSKHLQELQAELDIVKKKVADMSIAVTDIVDIEKEIIKQEEMVKDDVEAFAQQIMELVQESKEKLFSEVSTIAGQKKETLAKQKTEAQRILDRLKDCEVSVNDSVNNSSQPYVLAEKQNMLDRMRMACLDVEPTMFQPIEDADMRFGRNLSFLSNEEIGQFLSKSFDNALVELGPCVVNELSSTTLTLVSNDEEPFALPPTVVTATVLQKDSTPIKCSVSETSKGEYDISYTLTTVEEHKLVIRVGGFIVSGSPFSLLFPTMNSPTEKDVPIQTIPELSQPRGIAICDDDNIVLAENTAHCITVLNKKGKTIQTIGKRGTKGCFVYPQGVTVCNDKILYVTDEHRLHKVSITGSCVLKTVGKTTAGNGSMGFRNPHDIAVQPSTGHVFVADSGNNRIQVFRNDLSYLYTINNYHFTQSKHSECYNEPIGVAFDQAENLYVSEYLNHCITKVTAKGHFIAKIGSEGSDPGQLYGPSSITICDNHLYIAELGIDRVSIFDVKGRFVHCFWNRGKEDDSSTHSVAVDKMGTVYVTDNWNSLVIY